MANIREVAKKAGVSVATVSRVINHPETVSLLTKDRVLKQMKELDFAPSNLARGLALNKTYSIALLIPNILNPLYPDVAKGVEDIAHKHGYNLFLCNTEEDEKKERSYLQLLGNRSVDGCIIMSSILPNDELADLAKGSSHIALIGRRRQSSQFHCVFTDYVEGGYLAASYLIELGHNRIAHISGPRLQMESQDKYTGYLQALTDNGIKFINDYVREGNNEVEGGYIAAKQLLRTQSTPTAIFAANDLMAMGALEAIKSEGLRVPQDIAIVGYDNIKMSNLVEPKLTTVFNPVYKMGLTAARLLFDSLVRNQNKNTSVREIFLKPNLVVRKSCGNEDRIREIFS